MQDKNIQKARSALIALRPKAQFVASWGCISDKGLVVQYNPDQACHAPCANSCTQANAQVLYTICTGKTGLKQVPEDVQERYFAWLCSEDSPWAACLNNGLNTDPKFVAEYGLLIIDLDKHPRNLVGGALTASRACFEHPKHVMMWDKLVKDGLEPRWAFFLSGYVTENRPGHVTFGMVGNQNHWPLHPWAASELYIKNFLTQNVQFSKVPFVSKTTCSNGIGGIWGPYGERPADAYYGLQAYSEADYFNNFRAKVGTRLVKYDGAFSAVPVAHYEDFLKFAKQEQERLYAS